MRKILITNDDGIDADGIIRLAKAATKFGEVTVVAPDGQRSAMSHSINLRHAIDLYPVDFPVRGVKAYASTGTPADCVRVGHLNIMKGETDVLFSGINKGYNCATDVQYSATCGAAFEGTFQKIPSFAFSEGFSECTEVTDKYLEKIIEEVIDRDPGEMTIMNINFPECSLNDYKGILRDRVTDRGCVFTDSYTEETLPNGGIRYRVNGKHNERCEKGSDYEALSNGYISIGLVRNVR